MKTTKIENVGSWPGYFSAIISSLVVVCFAMVVLTASPAKADGGSGYNRYYKFPKISDALEAEGFGTLKFALDTTGLTPVLDDNRVTLFAPTDDVFEATAEALGCADALDLATSLLDIPVGDSNALVAVLTYHASLGVTRSKYRLLKSSPLETVNGGDVTTGVNSKGLYVKGAANAMPSTITDDGIRGFTDG